MSAKETWSGSRPFSGNRNCSTRKDCASTLQSSPARGMESKPSPERERVGCSIRSNKRREVAIRRCGWSSEVQSRADREPPVTNGWSLNNRCGVLTRKRCDASKVRGIGFRIAEIRMIQDIRRINAHFEFLGLHHTDPLDQIH